MTVKKGSSETRGVDVFDDETLIAECRLIDSPFVDFAFHLPRPCPNRGSDALITRVLPQTSTRYCPTKKDFTRSVFVAGSKPKTGCTSTPPLDQGHVAALWKTEEAWAIDGKVPASFLWTAMDCPAQFAFMRCIHPNGVDGQDVCGILTLPETGATLIVSAWTIAVQGKKHFAGAALFDETGNSLHVRPRFG